MTDENADATFVLAVPEALSSAASRLPARVRRTPGIEVWLVPDVGEVHPLEQ